MIDALAGSGAVASSAEQVSEPKNPGGALGQDEFLTLLVAQLKNQDPLNPLNAEQFAAQLAQFSSLEQLVKINDTLEGQAGQTEAMMTAMNASTALGVIGREVLASGNTVEITDEGVSPLVVGIGGEAASGTLKIYDDEGVEVGSMELGGLEAGRQEIEIDKAVSGLEPGRYTYTLELMDEEGMELEVQTFSRVHIDGVRYGPGGPVLISGDLEIPLSNVVEVLASTDQNTP